MSASRPSKPPSSYLSPSLGALRARRRRDRVWFGVSLGLHGLALAALVYLTPVREIVREVVRQARAETIMSGGEMAELADAIEEHAAEQVREDVTELGRVLERMGEMQHDVALEFSAFDARRREDAARDAEELMTAAVEHMQAAVQSIQEDAPIEETDRRQGMAEQAQERAARKLEMIDYDAAPVIAAQRSAAEAHQQAKGAHDRDRDLVDQVAARERDAQAQQVRADELAGRVRQMQEAGESAERIDAETRQRDEQATRARELHDALTQTRQERAQVHAEAADLQSRAVAAQQQALAALHALSAHAAGSAEHTGTGSPVPLPPSLGPPAPGASADVPGLYEAARASEDRIAETLKAVRAMDLAMVRGMEIEDALADIDVVRPLRPDLNADLLRGEARTGVLFEAHKQELGRALRETDSMVTLAHQMLEMATQSADKLTFGTDVAASVEAPGVLERPEFELVIRELAMEDVSGRFSDVSGVMAELTEGPQDPTAPPRGPDIEDLTGDVSGVRPTSFGAQVTEDGTFADLPRDVPAVGTRRLSAEGIPTQFAFIDTWYTIGPFPNPDRINIDREFPPDSLVDLDATYVGKDGRTIRWQFVQSDNPEMKPANPEEYGIWYAYTEFACDRPRDLWIAAGTDDRGTLKINGLPVWISSKRLKGWDIDEVWRRVHLREGINRILYRVENGWLHIGFSLTLRLEED
jgi:hypothetical protein